MGCQKRIGSVVTLAFPRLGPTIHKCVTVDLSRSAMRLTRRAVSTDFLVNKHHPTWTTATPRTRKCPSIPIPLVISSPRPGRTKPSPETEEDYSDLSEWLDLLALGSPRITGDDVIDPYLCRYSPPGGGSPTSGDLRVVQWQGLLSSNWVTELLVLIM